MLVYPIRLHDKKETERILRSIDVEPCAVGLLSPKSQHTNIILKSVKTSWANIIKQEMLACGGDAAISKSSYACLEKQTDVLLMGNESVLERFVAKMRMQPECFNCVADQVEKIIVKNTHEIRIGNKTFDLSKDFIVLGILNVTPDSFSDGGKFNDYDSAMRHAEHLLNSGANIIDVGGESTRPASHGITEQEEIDRVVPIIEAVNKNFDITVSIDSYKPEVIKSALSAGAKLVNDISAGKGVELTLDEMKKHEASALIMMNLTSGSYSGSAPDVGLCDPVATFFEFCESNERKFTGMGILRERLIFDPGIGFGLSKSDVGALLKNMYSFTGTNFAVCAGLSRKSYLGNITGLEVGERDTLTNAISLSLMEQGVKIFRTHDVKGLVSVIKFYKSVEEI
ncbi:MAG: dihydropteroate synthase [Proteobacteria bacterium]|nr:dihydropteroate synthase [Pseudomonadota bacterium]